MSSTTVSLHTAELNAVDDKNESEILDRSLSVWDSAIQAVTIDVYTAASIGSYGRIREIIQRSEYLQDLNRPGIWVYS